RMANGEWARPPGTPGVDPGEKKRRWVLTIRHSPFAIRGDRREPMTYADLTYERDGHLATITLNRPERMNAISGPMLRSLSQALGDADGDRDGRVIVITGAGRGFCAGLDLKDFSAGIGNGTSTNKFDLRDAPPMVLHQTDKPVLCALNGAAAGYGMDLAL